MYWHLPDYFNHDNFFGNTNNVFPDTISINMLCVHKSIPQDTEQLRAWSSPADRCQPPCKRPARTARLLRSLACPTWEFWIDVGGTFTDCFARAADGQLLALQGAQLRRRSRGRRRTVQRAATIVDPARSADPAGLLDRLRLATARRRRARRRRIDRHADSTRATGDACDSRVACRPSRTLGNRYELSADVEAPIIAIRYLLGLPLAQPIPPVSVRLGTTRGTNALLTRRGAKTAFVTTRGFGDVLRIGYQNRPRLFDLAIRKPQPLFAAVVEIDERVDADGRRAASRPMRSQVRAATGRAAQQQGIESLAICLLHAFAQPRARAARRPTSPARWASTEISVSQPRRAA